MIATRWILLVLMVIMVIGCAASSQWKAPEHIWRVVISGDTLHIIDATQGIWPKCRGAKILPLMTDQRPEGYLSDPRMCPQCRERYNSITSMEDAIKILDEMLKREKWRLRFWGEWPPDN